MLNPVAQCACLLASTQHDLDFEAICARLPAESDNWILTVQEAVRQLRDERIVRQEAARDARWARKG